ncbi:MAG: nicotinate-nucleotide adenylyltransferase [Burkholderiaceae bacterium]|nr:nicotinate-nucleotide adenylyltransferase [Burkholderiaceae bacterium]
MTRPRIGLLGGTFDPVHAGHLTLAHAARSALRLDEVRFIPTARSWQKDDAGASAEQRLAMVRLAIEPIDGFHADSREVERGGPSYTIDTLEDIRAELGAEPALVFLMGSDQLRNLASWHRGDELLEQAHIGCTRRGPGDGGPLEPKLAALLDARGRDALPDEPSGSIVFFTMPPVPVSATALRAGLARGDRPRELVPPAVLDYIETHQLYRRNSAN